MQPIISIFAPIGLILYYSVTKRNLLYHFQRPHYHSSSINSVVDLMLLLSLLAFGFGNLMVNNFIEDELNYEKNGTLWPNWIIVFIAASFILLTPLKIFYCCMKKPEFVSYDYMEKKMILKTDYDRLNPETQQTAVYEFRDCLKKLDDNRGLPKKAEFIKLTVDNVIEQQEQK